MAALFDTDVAFENSWFVFWEEHDGFEEFVGVGEVVADVASAVGGFAVVFKPGDEGGFCGLVEGDGFEVEVCGGGVCGSEGGCGGVDFCWGEGGEGVGGRRHFWGGSVVEQIRGLWTDWD